VEVMGTVVGSGVEGTHAVKIRQIASKITIYRLRAVFIVSSLSERNYSASCDQDSVGV
jgi:hypothetical protein